MCIRDRASHSHAAAEDRTTRVAPYRRPARPTSGADVPLLFVAADLAAITVLVYLSYFPRHRRREMVLAYIGLNVGVLAVAMVLTGSAVSIGLGMGLFGVLSLIRLRSDELSHEEVAYYFAALALGLIFGLTPDPAWLAPALGALIVLVMVVVDHAPIHSTAVSYTHLRAH